uniref:HEPN domain-containing protein n=1 Tax=Macrostomum lignano TaxID=282301 RepID=A0A1I8FZ52_9PLAT
MSSESESDGDTEGAELCGQSESLTRRLRNILRDYSDGLAIPKELIQNADDAGATEVTLIYDSRANLQWRETVMGRRMAGCLGPCLWAHNDAQFTDDDFKNLLSLGGATKEAQAAKVGKFGLGFNAVYNLTDVPAVLSGCQLQLLDPHGETRGRGFLEEIYRKYRKCDTGLRLNFSKEAGRRMLAKYPHQFAPYTGVMGCGPDLGAEPYPGTLIRLPLRTQEQAGESQICQRAYSEQEMRDLLDKTAQQARHLLLFTQSVSSFRLLHLRDGLDGSLQTDTLLKVSRSLIKCIRPLPGTSESADLRSQTRVLAAAAEYLAGDNGGAVDGSFAGQLKLHIDVQINETEAKRVGIDTNVAITASDNWLVSVALGSGESLEMSRQREGLSLPVASVAVRLSAGGTAIEPVNRGVAFCFLPLPIESPLLFHVNAAFAVTSSRRYLEEATMDEAEGRWHPGRWNAALLREAACTALVSALERLTAENITGAPSIWPLLEANNGLSSPKVIALQASFTPRLAGGRWLKLFFLDESALGAAALGFEAANVVRRLSRSLVPAGSGLAEGLASSVQAAAVRLNLLGHRLWSVKSLLPIFWNNLTVYRLRELASVEFLPAKRKPDDCSLHWRSDDYPVTQLFAPEVSLSLKDRECPPYLYRLPSDLRGGYFSHEKYLPFLKAIGVLEKFDCTTYCRVLEEIHENKSGSALTDSERKSCIELLTRLSELSELPEPSEIFAPDHEGFLVRCSHLCFGSVKWLSKVDKLRFAHKDLAYGVCEKLRIPDQRVQTLRKHHVPLPFGQKEELTTRLKGILQGYPLGIEIFKELVQNADDAGATRLHFINDRRNLGTEKVLSDEWKALQGPALVVVNDTTFNDEDIEGIQKLGVGSKGSQPWKTGQYGIGFNCVYHVTDVPMFLSDNRVLCVMDPHCRHMPHANTESPGGMYKDEGLDEVRDDFRDVFDGFKISNETTTGSTVFRLPLRTLETARLSEIFPAAKPLNSDDIYKLFKKFAEDLAEILLFLSSVKTIQLSELGTDGKLTKVFETSSTISDPSACIRFRGECQKIGRQLVQKDFDPKLLHSCTQEVYEATISTHNSFSQKPDSTSSKWIVAQQLGLPADSASVIPSKDQSKLGYAVSNGEWKALPKVGVAARLDQSKKFHREHRVFNLLPLPLTTDLPVHINGHFALDPSRRSLWEAHSSDASAEWNNLLVSTALPVCYATLLEAATQRLPLEDPIESDGNSSPFEHYYRLFPEAKDEKPGKSHWNTMAIEFYKEVFKNRREVFSVVDLTNQSMISWLPLAQSPQSVDGKSAFLQEDLSEDVSEVLQRLGLPLIVRGRRFTDCMKSSGLSYVPNANPDNIINYLKGVRCSALRDSLPIQVELTPFAGVPGVETLMHYLLTNLSLEDQTDTKDSERDSAEIRRMASLISTPLNLTADGMLRIFRTENLSFLTEYVRLIPAKSTDLLSQFCHKKIQEVFKPPPPPPSTSLPVRYFSRPNRCPSAHKSGLYRKFSIAEFRRCLGNFLPACGSPNVPCIPLARFETQLRGLKFADWIRDVWKFLSEEYEIGNWRSPTQCLLCSQYALNENPHKPRHLPSADMANSFACFVQQHQGAMEQVIGGRDLISELQRLPIFVTLSGECVALKNLSPRILPADLVFEEMHLWSRAAQIVPFQQSWCRASNFFDHRVDIFREFCPSEKFLPRQFQQDDMLTLMELAGLVTECSPDMVLWFANDTANLPLDLARNKSETLLKFVASQSFEQHRTEAFLSQLARISFIVPDVKPELQQLCDKGYFGNAGLADSFKQVRGKVMHKVYSFMSSLDQAASERYLNALRDSPCILVDNGSRFAQPSQVTLTERDEIPPFLFACPSGFLQYSELFLKLGVTRQPSIEQAAMVLQLIKSAAKDDSLPVALLEPTAKCICLLLSLLHQQGAFPTGIRLCLPTSVSTEEQTNKSYKLVEASQVVINDAVAYFERLGGATLSGIQFLDLEFCGISADQQRTLERHLNKDLVVPRLSELVKEQLVPDECPECSAGEAGC